MTTGRTQTSTDADRQPAGGFTSADAAADAGVGMGGAYAPPAAPLPESSVGGARRSLIGQALYDTFGQTGARIGLVWIAFLAALAVFAPLLANSHPILMKLKGGGWSSPMLVFLTPLDLSLLVYFAYACAVLARRLPAPQALAHLLWPVMAAAVIVPAGFVAAALVAVVRMRRPLLSLALYRPDWLADLGWSAGGVLGWAWVILVNLAVVALAAGAVLLAVRASIAFFRDLRPAPALKVAAVITVVAVAAAWFFKTTPENVIYERYRESEKAGRVDRIARTVIPYSPNDRLRDRPEEVLQPPSARHWLGTTQFGEDMLSRMIHACRVALGIGVIATGIATVIGIAVGGLMGRYAGWVDLIGMRVLEIVEAIPTLILLLIVTVFFGRNLYLMMVVIGLVTWTPDARFIRAEFLKLRNLDFVQAAVAAGLSRTSIIFRHMLPNGVAPVLVNASFSIAGAILLESTLSFLGLGLGPDDPSWGQLLNQARSGGRGFNWWIATFPGLAIFLTVFAYILIGEAMRDALDPKLRKRD